MTIEAEDPADRLIRLAEVKHRVGFGKTVIYAMIAEHKFPRPYKPTGGAARWSAREIDAWIEHVTSGTGREGQSAGASSDARLTAPGIRK